MRVNCSLPGRRGDRVVGERGEGLGVPERIPNPPPGLTTPGYFLAEGGPRRQSVAGEGLGQTQE